MRETRKPCVDGDSIEKLDPARNGWNQLLILQCHDAKGEAKGSSVDIDTRYNTIINRSLIGSAQRFLDTPDYFEYIVTKAQACQSK